MQTILVIFAILLSILFLGSKFGLWSIGRKKKKGCDGCAIGGFKDVEKEGQ